MPAFRALKTSLPQAWITLIGLPWAHRFVERFNSYLDDFIPLPGYPGFPEQNPEVSLFPDFLARVQRSQYDLAIQMQGSGEISNPLIMLLGAKYCAGFFLPGQYCPDPERFLPYPEHEPQVWRHLRLMEFLAMPLQGDDLEFPLYDQDWEELEGITAKFAIQSDYVCIHLLVLHLLCELVEKQVSASPLAAIEPLSDILAEEKKSSWDLHSPIPVHIRRSRYRE